MSEDKKRGQKPLTDEEVLAKVEGAVGRGVSFYDTKLSKERERVIDYKNLKLPRRQSEGKSSYVSSDVYDSCAAMKAMLLETFAGNPDNLVSFPPQGPEDIDDSRVATEYSNYQVHRLNDGYHVFSAAIDDGLSARVGITKVYWEKCEDKSEETIEGASLQDVQALASQEDISDLEADDDDGAGNSSGVFKGKLTRTIDRSKVRLLPVPPEEFGLYPQGAKSIPDADVVFHYTRKFKDELIKDGYDRKKVESINWSDPRSLDLRGEKLAREQPVSDGRDDDGDLLEAQKVMVYETYAKLDMKDGKGVRLWKVVHAGNVLLHKEEVDCVPFKVFVPLPVPHSFYGDNFCARVIPTQNARTVLMRAILDHASVTTNPRWGVVKGGLANPKEMLDNRLGGIVNLNRPDAIKPIEQQPLNPFVFQTIGVLKENKEESTGISSLSQGMNKEAISSQNSDDMVERLVTLSQQRQKIMARNFVYGYLIPLYLEVYRLVLENEKPGKIVEVAGQYKPVDPSRWIERLDCKVAVSVGYGDRQKQAGKLMMLYERLAADPALAPSFQLKNRIQLANDAMRMDGDIPNYAAYLTPAEQVQPPQPDPIEMMKAQAALTTAQAAKTAADAGVLKTAKSAEVAAENVTLKEGKQHIDAIFKAREADRQDADVANRIDVSQRETKVLEETPEPNAIASPS